MRDLQMAKLILYQMQISDQKITPIGCSAQYRTHFAAGLILKLATFWAAPPLAFARFPSALAIIRRHWLPLPEVVIDQ